MTREVTRQVARGVAYAEPPNPGYNVRVQDFSPNVAPATALWPYQPLNVTMANEGPPTPPNGLRSNLVGHPNHINNASHAGLCQP